MFLCWTGVGRPGSGGITREFPSHKNRYCRLVMTPQPEADFISEEPSVKSTYCCIVGGFWSMTQYLEWVKRGPCYCFLSKTQFDKGLHGTLVVGKPLQHADRHSRNQHGAQIEASQCLRRKWSGGNLQVISKLLRTWPRITLRSSKMNHGLPDGCEGEKACRAASPCPYGRAEALHCRIVIAIHLCRLLM